MEPGLAERLASKLVAIVLAFVILVTLTTPLGEVCRTLTEQVHRGEASSRNPKAPQLLSFRCALPALDLFWMDVRLKDKYPSKPLI
jgi:hypothetical protein